MGFPGGEESVCNAGDLGSLPGLGRSLGERNGYPLQYSSLENSMGCISMGSQRVGHDWVTFTLLLYQLSHQGSPRILEWVAYPFSSGSSWPRNHTRVSCMAGRFFTNWAIREVYHETNMDASSINCFFLAECPCETGSVGRLDYLEWGHINGLTCPYTITVLMGLQAGTLAISPGSP